MRIWECDMCKKTLREDYDVYEISCGHPKKCDDVVACEVGVHKMVAYTTYELCSDCAKSVERFVKGEYNDQLKKIIEKAREPVEPRKTCNTCVHFMRAKSRCMKKQLPIRENDRDACLGWSDIKHCDNCKWSVAGRECYKERVYCGKTGYCDQWES